MRGRAAVGSAHAGMMRPLELEALVAQKRVHRSCRVLQAAARPSPPAPLSPLSTKGRGGARGIGAQQRPRLDSARLAVVRPTNLVRR